MTDLLLLLTAAVAVVLWLSLSRALFEGWDDHPAETLIKGTAALLLYFGAFICFGIFINFVVQLGGGL